MYNDNLALLAAAAYGEFPEKNKTGNVRDDKAQIDNIHDTLTTKAEMSSAQAKKFTDTYEILAHQPNTASGYSGTIVRNKNTNEIFVLHRGTEFATKEDIFADGKLVLVGIARQQSEDAKRFVDNAIQRGIITGEFTNVGHSLGKAIGDVVHFTTNLSKGSIGFNGAGISLRKIPEIYRRYPTPILTTPPLDPISENEKFLERLARQGGNTFSIKENSTINYVSNGVRIIPNNIIYNQYGKVINIDIGTSTHSINPFIDPMDTVIKLSNKYNLNTNEAIQYYNVATGSDYYNPIATLGYVILSKYNSLVNINKAIETYIAKNPDINIPNVNKFLQMLYINDKVASNNKISSSYWENYISNINKTNKTPTNKFDISTTPILDKNSNNDAVSLSPALYALLDKDILNKHNDPFSVSISNITTNGFRISNYNLSKGIFDNDNKSVLNEKYSFIKDPKLLNKVKGFGYSRLPVDPLILDLNGDGVRAVSYNEKPVLFDIDNDGGSLEETGWLSHQDGLLVRDLNNNGKIDNMSEVFSEYYAGRAGRNGEAGEKRFANGFEALKSLDSNKDNVFDSKDRDFNAVRVWQDANHNGVTDAGELKTLSSLKITAIDLAYQNAGGQLFFGNELLAKGYFTRNGKKHEAAAVNFLANPRGHTITNVSGGKKTVTEAAGVLAKTTSFTAEGNQARTLEAKKLRVMNIQAGNGNDTLRGDEQDNWLAGGGGSDTFFGGDGNDVLLIDGDDLPQNIHGGNGDDIVQVVGNKGVSLDLGAAEVEIAHGGRGNDVFVSSGNSSVFVRGGDGNDVIVGSIANDALSGENGDDFVSGNAGKDLIRGHRGNDRLFGDEGDDVLFGGSDDDMLYGGEGADILLGEGGDDYLDGGEGEDVAEFSGNFADYKITKMGDGLLISDTKQGRDGTDFLRNIEKLNFKDLTGYAAPSTETEWENPMPVKDILYQDSKGQRFDGSLPYIIKQSQLLKNDIDVQGDNISIYQVFNIHCKKHAEINRL